LAGLWDFPLGGWRKRDVEDSVRYPVLLAVVSVEWAVLVS
jgi:hypothetical protein